MNALAEAAPLDVRQRSRVAVPFIVVTLIWGSTWIVIRDQLGVVPASWSVTYRFLVASAAMFAWVLATRSPVRLPARAIGVAAGVGLFQFVLNFNFVYRAEHFVTSGIVAVVFATLLVPNAILGRIFLGSHLSRPFLLGSLVAMGGIALLFHHEMAGAGGAGATSRWASASPCWRSSRRPPPTSSRRPNGRGSCRCRASSPGRCWPVRWPMASSPGPRPGRR